MRYENIDIENLSDSELVVNYKNTSDKRFVGELYKRYTHLVLGMCINYFKDRDEAKDVVVLIFEKLFIELQRHEINNFKPWLTHVVRNYCIEQLRKKEVQQRRDLAYYEEVKNNLEEADTEASEKKNKELEKLEKVMDELNPFQKKCIELFYLKDMTYTQIVETTGFSANEVKSYLQNGRKNLKSLMINTK